MHEPDLVYTIVDPHFYEELTRYRAAADYHDHVRALLPADWELQRRSLWLHANPPGNHSPTQGFKIHVSSIGEHARDVLSAVVPELAARGVPFKLAADPRMLRLLNSKVYERGGSGKFMTIYPADDEAFRELIQALHERTAATPFMGPYILSDRRYRDSRILFYRYGGIRSVEKMEVDGVRRPMLTAPDGELVRDVRWPFFRLPDWVDDPFGGSRELEDEPNPVLAGRFAVEAMLTASNRGGVYTGTDLETGQSVVIKEARPYINRVSGTEAAIDSSDLLEREHRTLKRLRHLGLTPQPIACFSEWEHHFLVQEKLEGTVLMRFGARMENLVLPYVLRPGVLEGFLPTFVAVAGPLIDAVEAVHGENVVIGDLSPSNVLVAPDLSRVWLIDLEAAVGLDEGPMFMRFSRDWNTPGYVRPGRRTAQSLTFADDHYALGMAILHLFVGGLQFFDLKPGGQREVLDRLVALGIPPQVRDTVVALMDGSPEQARAAVDSLRREVGTARRVAA
jgi:tRNA A-37 threonylcarbamoyl transferase component Bud32